MKISKKNLHSSRKNEIIQLKYTTVRTNHVKTSNTKLLKKYRIISGGNLNFLCGCPNFFNAKEDAKISHQYLSLA